WARGRPPRCPRCAGASRRTSSSHGCSRSRPRPSSRPSCTSCSASCSDRPGPPESGRREYLVAGMVPDRTRGLGSRLMGDVGTSLTVALAAARHQAIEGETTEGDATPCRVLGELLGLDAAWILDAGGPPPPR